MELAKIIKEMRKSVLTLLLTTLMVTSGYSASKAVVASTIQLPEQEVVYNKGIELLKKKEYDAAIIKFTASISIDSTFTKAYYNRAVANFNLEKYTKTISDLKVAIRQYGEAESADCYLLLSKADYALGNITESTEIIDKLLEQNPYNTKALLDKGAILQVTEQYDKAIEVYNSIIYRTGGNAPAYNEQGNCFYAIGDIERAYECYRKAHIADPENKKITYNFATATWSAKKDSATAFNLLNGLIKEEIDNADYYNAKGYMYVQLGMTDDAIENFNMAIALNHSLASAYNGKGTALYLAKMYSDALLEFNKSIDANTNYGDAYVNRAIAKEATGDYSGACADFKRGVELGAKNAQLYYSKQCD